MRNVVAHEFEALVVKQVIDVMPCAGEEIVHAQHLALPIKQAFAQMRPKESSAPCHKDSSL
jgi:hypothetical protein